MAQPMHQPSGPAPALEGLGPAPVPQGAIISTPRTVAEFRVQSDRVRGFGPNLTNPKLGGKRQHWAPGLNLIESLGFRVWAITWDEKRCQFQTVWSA